MVMVRTKLIINDNSGGLLGRCIQIYNKKLYANTGEVIKISIKKKNPKKKNIKNKMYPALLLTIKKQFYRKNGIYIKFSKNRVLLITEQYKLLGTRYKGPITKESLIFKKKIQKLISLAKYIL